MERGYVAETVADFRLANDPHERARYRYDEHLQEPERHDGLSPA